MCRNFAHTAKIPRPFHGIFEKTVYDRYSSESEKLFLLCVKFFLGYHAAVEKLFVSFQLVGDRVICDRWASSAGGSVLLRGISRLLRPVIRRSARALRSFGIRRGLRRGNILRHRRQIQRASAVVDRIKHRLCELVRVLHERNGDVFRSRSDGQRFAGAEFVRKRFGPVYVFDIFKRADNIRADLTKRRTASTRAICDRARISDRRYPRGGTTFRA